MASPLDKQVDMHIEESALEKGIVTPSPSSSEKEGSPLKYNEKGVALVPQPSDDPRDPLVCWSLFLSSRTKYRVDNV